MKKVSTKQAQKNRQLAEIKKRLPRICSICGKRGDDLAHILPKSIFPEHYTEEWNLTILCRSCHTRFDDDRHFRSQQSELFLKVAYHDEQGAKRHFN